MRKSMKKLIALTLACLMLATLFVGCGKKDDGGSSGGDTIKLGWMGSLTGDQAAYGTCESQTLKMLVEDLNANGGLLGKQVELICYDTKGDAQEAVNVAKRLCAQDQVCAIIGPNASGQCIAIQSVLDQYKISDMSTVATNEKVTMQDGQLKEYNFRVCFLDPQQGKIAGSFVYDNLGFDKAAILYDVNDDYALGLKDNFVKVFESKGGTIVAEEGYTAGDTDFTAQLTKIKEAQPQIIFTPIFYQDFIMIHKQARTLGIEVPMLGGDGCASEVLFDAADAVDGSYVINHVSLVDPAATPSARSMPRSTTARRWSSTATWRTTRSCSGARRSRRPAAMTRRPSPTRTLRSRSRVWPVRSRSLPRTTTPSASPAAWSASTARTRPTSLRPTSPRTKHIPKTEKASTLSTLGRPARGARG